jgi:hypothetical protein
MSRRKSHRARRKPAAPAAPAPDVEAGGAEPPPGQDRLLRRLFVIGFVGATFGAILGFGLIYWFQWLRLGKNMGIWGLVPAMFIGGPVGAVSGALLATVAAIRRMPDEPGEH